MIALRSMNKRKFKSGDIYSVRPKPQGSDLVVLDECIKVLSIKDKGLWVEHVQTQKQGDLFWDAITDFRNPNHLMLKGQMWISADVLHVDPLPDPRKVFQTAKQLGMVGSVEAESVRDEDKEEYKNIIEIVSGRKTAEKVKSLKELLYVVKAKASELQILLALIVWHTPPKDTPSDGISLCNRGIEIAKQLNSERFYAVLLSHRALFGVQQWLDEDLKFFANIKISNAIGFPFVTPEEQANCVVRLNNMQKGVESDIKAAYESANKSKDPEVIGGVLNNHISMLGLEGLHRKQCSVPGWESCRDRVKERFALGKEFLRKTGQEGMLGYLYHNAANQLRFFNERDQAIGLAKEAIKIAEKVGNEDLRAMAQELLDRLQEG